MLLPLMLPKSIMSIGMFLLGSLDVRPQLCKPIGSEIFHSLGIELFGGAVGWPGSVVILGPETVEGETLPPEISWVFAAWEILMFVLVAEFRLVGHG